MYADYRSRLGERNGALLTGSKRAGLSPGNRSRFSTSSPGSQRLHQDAEDGGMCESPTVTDRGTDGGSTLGGEVVDDNGRKSAGDEGRKSAGEGGRKSAEDQEREHAAPDRVFGEANPQQLERMVKLNEDPPDFGQDMRDLEFLLDPEGTFINHGGFGAVPRRVMDEYKR